MPFNGDEFTRLGLPPYSGALAAEFQNLADGLTLLKGETVTIDNETVRLAIGGMPGDGQVIKFDLATTSLVWRDDNVGMAGGGEENVQVDWAVTDTTSDAFIQNKPALSFLPLTGGTLTGPLTVPSIDFTGTLFTTQSNLGLGNVPHAAPILTGGALRFTSLSGTVTDITLPTGGGGGGGDDAFDWATVGNTDRMPYDKHGLDVVIGITSVTYDTGTRNLRVRLPQVDGGDTFQEVELPEWLTAAGIADWAETGDNSNVPNSKLPGTLVTAIDAFTYDVSSHTIQLQLTRLSGGPVAGTVTIPEFLAESAVETWALIANPNEVIPSAKLPAHTVGLLPAFDPGSNVFSIARTTSAGSTVTTTTTFPEWAEEADLYDWAFTGNADRLPYSKIPIHLRSLGTFSFDANTRQITFNFNDTTPTLQTRIITLPDYLTAADVTSFDIHDGVADTAPVQDPDRFIFSNENVAGDPTQYIRADGLSDYVLGNIAPVHIPDSIARDADIEAWALVANPATLIPYQKISNVVRSIGALNFNATSRSLSINLQRSSGANEAVSAILPDWIEAGTISDWAETANTDTIPEAKIPSLPTGKIFGLTEFVDDRVGNQLIQHGDNLVWTYDDAAGQLTGNVSTNLDDVTQIIRDVVNPLGPGLTESFVPSTNRLNIGLDIDTIIQVGSNMTKSVVAGVMTLNATAMGGGGINAEDAVDAVAAALTGGSKISVSYDDPNNEIEISTTALNASEVNTRIDTRVGTLLPTVTAGEASIDDGDERRIWTSRRVRQAANLSAQTHIVGVASPIDVADPTTNTDVFAASKRSVAQAIADNMGTGGMADGIVNSLDLSRSGRDLTVTLGRSIGADLTETVQLPADENRFADSLGVLVTGQTLTVTIGRTAPLPDLVDTATLPTGGGGGTDTNSFVTGGIFTLTGQELSLQLTGNTGFTTVDVPAITLPAGGGGTDTNDYVDSLDLSLSGSALTVALGRTGSLADLSETITLPTASATPGMGSTELFNANVAAGSVDLARSTGYTLPSVADHQWFLINTGKPAAGSTSTDDFDGAWHWVLLQDLYDLAETSAGDNLDDAADANPTGALEIQNVVGGSTEMYFGRTSANELLVATGSTSGGVRPLRIFSAPMGMGGGGGSGDDAFDWATVGNTDLVPTAKLGTGTANINRVLRGDQTYGRLTAHMLTANFVDNESPDEADYMLFADSGSARALSFITYGAFLDGIAGAGLIHGGETIHLDATGAMTGQVFSYTGDGTTLGFEWVDLPTGGGGGTSVSANPAGLQAAQLKTVTIGSTDYQVRSTFAAKYLSDRPVADLSTVGHVYHVLQEGQAFFGVEDSHQSSTPTGTFNNIPNRSDLHIVATLPTNLNNLSTGDFYYHAGGDPARGGYEFYEVVVRGTKQLQNVHASRALAASRSNNSFNINWLGSNADSTEALAFTDAISSTANYFFHNETTDTIQRLDNTTYSGPSVEPHYRWLAIGGGGSGGTEDGVADSLDLSVSSGALTMTLGRTVGADLTDTVTLPSTTNTNDYVDGVVMALGSGSSLSVTLERTGSLVDLTAVIDLPDAGLSEVEHDETLLGVGSTADPLGVSVHDVIEQFAESVKYFTTSTSLNTGNFAAKGPRFTTGNHEFHLTAVEMEYNPGNVEYFARILQLDDTTLEIAAVLGSSPHYQDTGTYITKKMKFSPSVRIPANSRIAIMLIRRHAGASDIVLGSEAAASPETSFSLASTDWVHTGNVRLNSVNPTAGEFVGNFSNSNVAGNCKIYYTHPFHQYLPDESVGANNIDSGNAVAGEVLRSDGSGGANFYDLQLGTAAQEDTGTASGDVATLGTGGRFDVERVAWEGSQAAYDALTPDADTIYFITS